MSDFIPLREAVDALAGRASAPTIGELERRAIRRGRRRIGVVACAAAAAVVVGSAVAVSGFDGDRRTAPDPADDPTPAMDSAPVWYDADGLHRGDVVEETPIEIGQPVTADILTGALALVRSGAMYVDPATGDVWFHPWDGAARVVGHDSEAGPGGDPNGDIAVWFEDSDADALDAGPGELVVYDTSTGREISRTMQRHGVAHGCCQSLAEGNEFLQVSAERVVWGSGLNVYSHDIGSRTTAKIPSSESLALMDVHDEIEVLFDEKADSGRLVLRAPGRDDQRFPGLTYDVRLSPSGDYLLAVDIAGADPVAVIIDTRTAELWQVPMDGYPLLAWSSDDIAMVDHLEGGLIACDAARRTCEPLPAQDPSLAPTN